MEKRRYPTLLLLITLLLSTLMLHANSTTQAPITAHKLKRMDQQLTHRKTTPKHFKSQREFEQMKRRHHRRTSTTHHTESFDEASTYHRPRGERIEGASSFKRGWYLAYLHDRASFDDQYGYHYGYFNRNGYYFEQVFYRYDRDYTYQDRLRGRGLFDPRYYLPSNYRYYGFEAPRSYPSRYRR